MTSVTGSGLSRLYGFFEKYGRERLDGLDKSYFAGLTDSERAEAWAYLKKDFFLSIDCICGLYLLDRIKAVALFKQSLELSIDSPYPAERSALAINRLLLLRHINSAEPDVTYIDRMTDFASSEFPQVRAEFAQALPVHQATRRAVDALKNMILTETETIALGSAITKLMGVHGLDYKNDDPVYKSIYLSLRSKDPDEKRAGMKRLEQIRTVDTGGTSHHPVPTAPSEAKQDDPGVR